MGVVATPLIAAVRSLFVQLTTHELPHFEMMPQPLVRFGATYWSEAVCGNRSGCHSRIKWQPLRLPTVRLHHEPAYPQTLIPQVGMVQKPGGPGDMWRVCIGCARNATHSLPDRKRLTPRVGCT